MIVGMEASGEPFDSQPVSQSNALRATASQSDRLQGTYRDQQAAHGNSCRENACC